jgi:8-oxo-dGTP diphosphatase
VRHGVAAARERWSGPEDRRPLTEEGRLQADGLADALSDQPLALLLSSPFLRCTQTLVPLARARGLQIEPRDELADGRSLGYIERLVSEAATAGPAALCVHGEGMQQLVGELFDRGTAMTGDRDDHAKGGMWVLEVRDGAIASGRYVPPPGA